MRRLALILLALSAGGAADPGRPMDSVTETAEPVRMCVFDNAPISCAYLWALIQKARDDLEKRDRSI